MNKLQELLFNYNWQDIELKEIDDFFILECNKILCKE